MCTWFTAQTFRNSSESWLIYWQSIHQDSVPNDILFNHGAGRSHRPDPVMSLTETGAYEFDLSFPRLVNGEPVIRPGDKSFNIQFVNPAVGAGSRSGSTPSSAPSGPSTAPAAGGAVAHTQGKRRRYQKSVTTHRERHQSHQSCGGEFQSGARTG